MFSSAAFRPASAAVESASVALMLAFCALTSASRLDVFDLGEQLTFADVVAFLDQELRDAAHGVCADVDVVLGLDFAGGGHEAGQVLLDDLAGLHGDDAALAVDGAGVDADAPRSRPRLE